MYRDLICYDYETGSRNANKTQPTQLAAIALDGRTFRVKGTFNSEIRAIVDNDQAIAAGLDPLEEEALRITRKTREGISKAPLLKSVWEKFVEFVNKYNWKRTPFTAPIPCGFNINNFDSIITARLCAEYGPFNKETQKQTLFNQVYKIDVMDMLYLWTEGDPSVKSISMDAMRERMQMKSENAHDALQDVKDTANIMIKFMKTHRAVYRNLDLEKAFADGMYL